MGVTFEIFQGDGILPVEMLVLKRQARRQPVVSPGAEAELATLLTVAGTLVVELERLWTSTTPAGLAKLQHD